MQIFKDLFKKLDADNPHDSVNLIPKRFRQLFRDHGVADSQIPRLFSEITFDDLKSDESLIKKLTPALVDQVAAFFNVRSEWIEAVDDRIYSPLSCYKQPELFFELFNAIKIDSFDFPLRLITSVEKLDYKSDQYQPVMLVLVEKIRQIGDDVIYRYYLDDEWDWAHAPCRIQLKAIAKVVYQHLRKPITIYKVSDAVFEAIADKSQFPEPYMRGGLCSDPSLEDYVMEHKNSRVAKEVEELDDVMRYIEDFGLKALLAKEPDISSSSTNETQESDSSLQQKASRARHEPVNQLKRDCVLFWHKNKSLSNNETARRFYHSLTPDRKKLLSPTNAEKTLATAISEFKRKDELQLLGKLPYWLVNFNP